MGLKEVIGEFILKFIVTIALVVIAFWVKKIFNFTFEFILLFILFFMWTELNIRIGELKK